LRIIDLTEENERLYFVCLEDWSPEILEAGSVSSGNGAYLLLAFQTDQAS